MQAAPIKIPNTNRFRRMMEAARVADFLATEKKREDEAYEAMSDDEKRSVDQLRRRQKANLEKRERRTKGLPFSRCKLITMRAGPMPGMPGTLTIKHPRTGMKRLVANEQLLDVFMPLAPENLKNAMLGK